MTGKFLFSVFVIIGFLIGQSGCTPPRVSQEKPLFRNLENERRADYLRDYLSLHPDDMASRIELARLYLLDNLIAEALEELDSVLGREPDNVEAMILSALALQRLPKPNLIKAVTYLEKVTDMEPDNHDVRLNLGHLYIKVNKHEEAVSLFENFLKSSHDPSLRVSAYLGLSAAYDKLGKKEKSAEAYDAACRISPDVEKVRRQANIRAMTPAPQYAGEGLPEGRGVHPPLRKRIENIKQGLRELQESQP